MKLFSGYSKLTIGDSSVLLAGGGSKPISEFKIGDYLPLSGGTMTGDITWNADSHGIYLYNGCGIEKWSGYGPSLVAESGTDFYISDKSNRDTRYLILTTNNLSTYLSNGTGGSSISLAGNGFLASGRSTSYSYGYSFSLGDSAKSMGLYSGADGEEGGVVVSPDTCIVYNSSDTGHNFSVYDKDLGGDFTTATSMTFDIIGNGDYRAWSRGGFYKNGSDDNYALLGGGGHKALSDFSMIGHTHSYLPLSGGWMNQQAQIGCYTSSTDSYYGGALQIREYNGVTTDLSDWVYAPRISFHWGGRAVNSLGMQYDGNLAWGNYPLLHSGNYNSWAVPLSGGTMTGNLQFNSTSTNHIQFQSSDYYSGGASEHMSIGYGRIQCWGQIYINGDTDGSQSEMVLITSGRGVSTSTADGLKIGYNSLTWMDNNIWHAGNDGSGSGLDADTLDTYLASTFLTTGTRNLVTYAECTERNSSSEYMEICSTYAIIEKYGLGWYTVSFDIRTDVDQTGTFYTAPYASKYGFNPNYVSIESKTYWTHKVFRIQMIQTSETNPASGISVYFTYGSGAYVHIKNLKVEKGQVESCFTEPLEYYLNRDSISELDSRYVNTNGDTMTSALCGTRIWLNYNSNLSSDYYWTNSALTVPSIEILNYTGVDYNVFPTLAFHWYGNGGPLLRADESNNLWIESAGSNSARTATSSNTYFNALKLTCRDSNGIYVNGNNIWHSGNDGSGTGLDADTLDGYHNGRITASKWWTTSHIDDWYERSDWDGSYFWLTAMNGSGSTLPSAVAYSTSSGNADTVDGYHASSFVPKFAGTGSVAYYHQSCLDWSGVKIVIPGGYNSWMIAFTLRIYSSYQYTDIVISGYHYGDNHWYSPAARVIGGTLNFRVVMGYDGYDLYVWFGYTSGTLGYGGFSIMNLHAGHSTGPDWYSGWTVSNVAYSSLTNKLYDLDTILPSMEGHTHNYLPLGGGTMTGTPYINMPASAASISNSEPFGITYGRIQGYGDLYINGDTDGSTSEYVHITAGYGAGTSGVSYGLGIGYNNLYWKGGVLFANTSNVGIGTTSPSYKLDVNGTLNATRILVNSATYGSDSLTVGGSIRITGGSGGGHAAGLRRIFFGDGTNACLGEGGDGGDTDYLYLRGLHKILLECNSGSATLDTNGNFSAVNFYTTSDQRKKTNIIPISKSIRSFNLLDSGLKGYGYIAQELEVEHPELVDTKDEYWTVNYNSAICLNIATIENDVDYLKAKISRLETEISNLKTLLG